MAPILGIIASGQSGNLAAFDSIATVAGTGSSGTITFSSIPSGYKSLQIRYIAKSTTTGTAARYIPTIQFNGDTGSNYAAHALSGTSTTAASTNATTQTNISTLYSVIPNSGTGYTNMHGIGVLDIYDYTSTSKAKTLRGFSGVNVNATANLVNFHSGLWFATPAAITSISITVPTGSWTTTSSFSLYGVK